MTWRALDISTIVSNGIPYTTKSSKLLLDASRDLADKDGVTPLEHARTRGDAEIAELLEAADQ